MRQVLVLNWHYLLREYFFALILCSLLSIHSTTLFSANAERQYVADHEIYQVSVQLKRSLKDVLQVACYQEEPGTLKVEELGLTFRSYKSILRRLKRSDSDNGAKRRRIKRISIMGAEACLLKNQRVFEENGDLTVPGRLFLDVPTEIIGNISRGEALAVPTCMQCHEERRNRNFSLLAERLPLPPMNYTDFSNQDIADLTAYFNRYREYAD